MPACKHPRNTYTQPSLTGKKLLNLQKAEEEEDATGSSSLPPFPGDDGSADGWGL